MKSFYIKTFLTLLLVTISTITYGQIVAQEEEQKISFVVYDGIKYTDCNVQILEGAEDSFYLVIQPNEPSQDFAPFQIYLQLRPLEDQIPEGLFSYGDEDVFIDNSLWVSYEDWSFVHHSYDKNRTKLYIQRFGDDNYLISGKIEYNIEENTPVEFAYFGKIIPTQNEVSQIQAFNPEGYMNNQGEATIQGETVSIPYAYRERKNNKSWRLYFNDRLTFIDHYLDYGFYFDFHDTENIPEGTFKLNDEATNSLGKVGFFNKGKIEYPTNSEIAIRYNKKRDSYSISYLIHTEEGDIIKGTYKGKIPKSNF